MGAVTNMRPDLFRVVLSHVPFVDIMNTMLDASLPLTVAEYEEWGNPNEPEAFATMLSYSPYDNLESLAGKDIPAILVKTSLNDSQVMYWEPAKYVASSAPSRPTPPRSCSTSTWTPATAEPPAATTTSKKSPSTTPSS